MKAMEEIRLKNEELKAHVNLLISKQESKTTNKN